MTLAPSAPLAPLDSLFSVEGLDAPCRVHRHADQVFASLQAWADERGYPTAGLGALAARAGAEATVDRALLLGQWFVWHMVLDDVISTGALADEPRAVSWQYQEFRDVIQGRLPGSANPLTLVFAELWARTAPLASKAWQRRFAVELDRHKQGCLTELANRLAHRSPRLVEYTRLRRLTNGGFLFLLPEPVLGVEVPAALRDGPAWTELVDACNDVTAWCNDLVSAAKERACGDPHNYVLVTATELDLPLASAFDLVREHIARRMAELSAAARALPAEFARVGLDQGSARQVSKVAMMLMAAPRAQLEWLTATLRYTPAGFP